MNKKQLKMMTNHFAAKANLENVVRGKPEYDTLYSMALVEYVRFFKKKEAKLIKYIEEKTTENTVDGGMKILSASQIQHVLKILKKDWKGADADADKNKNKSNTDEHIRSDKERESSIVCA